MELIIMVSRGAAALLLFTCSSCLSFALNNSSCIPECIGHEDCPDRLSCIQNKCYDPCVSRCGKNTQCKVIDHIPTCACLEGYAGDALQECLPQVSVHACTSQWPPAAAGNKKFYLETTYKANWFSASLHCMRNNSRLARVESQRENMEVLQLIRNTGLRLTFFALDGSDLAKEGSWFWTSTGEPIIGYSAWLGGNPDNYNNKENCMSMWEYDKNDGYGWNDHNCESEEYFICEYY